MPGILIVEDENIVALDIKHHLEKFGYKVAGMAATGEEVLDRFESISPDLLLMDIKLQGDLDGVETARIINEKYKKPVILLTAFADEETVARAKITQPYGYIIKPFEERELRTAIEIALYRAEMEEKLSASEVQRKRLEEQLRQTQKMEAIGRLAGGVAHDFNNIITAIMGYGNLLMEEIGKAAGAKDDVEGILKASKKASNLTRQLLAFSRNQALNPKVVDLNGLVQDMEKMIRRLLNEDISMILRLRASKPFVIIDPGQMEQVIVNLAVNAKDAMPNGGRLIIETRNLKSDSPSISEFDQVPPGSYVEFSLSDTGTGIEPEILPRIFEPFFTTKDRDHGTGLGLATVYGIVKQSGGYIHVESTLKKGTAFKFLLPLTEAASAETETNSPLVSVPEEGATILLVEDEDYLRDLVTRMLGKAGYRVLDAASPGDAILIGENKGEEIDLLLTDVVMPRMNGYQLAARIKELRPGIRTVFMSGYPEKVPDEASLNKKTFLQKPFTLEGLCEKLREVMKTPQGE
jgi:two-component system cell cycle sensor histidine kinase/response regulator CckA